MNGRGSHDLNSGMRMGMSDGKSWGFDGMLFVERKDRQGLNLVKARLIFSLSLAFFDLAWLGSVARSNSQDY